MFTSAKGVLSENQFLQKKNRELLNFSFTGNIGDNSSLEADDEQVDIELTGISRLDSSRDENDQVKKPTKNGEKKLSLGSPNFFACREEMASDSKLQKKPQKKSLKVSEQEGQGYVLDPKKVAKGDSRQTPMAARLSTSGTFPTSILKR